MIERLNKDISEALKSGDKKRADSLKMLKNSLLNAQKAKNKQVGQDETFRIVRKEIKLRQEARDMYAKNDRPELASKEEYERCLFDNYLPASLTELQINKIIRQIIDNLDGDISFSKLMPEVIKQVSGRADGKTVAELVNKTIEGAKG